MVVLKYLVKLKYSRITSTHNNKQNVITLEDISKIYIYISSIYLYRYISRYLKDIFIYLEGIIKNVSFLVFEFWYDIY